VWLPGAVREVIIFLLDLSPPLVLIVAVLIYKCFLVLITVWERDSFLSFLSFLLSVH